MMACVKGMTERIAHILQDACPSMYLYGSAAEEDFRPGWSDIDILVLTETEISQAQADALLMLRQKMVQETGDSRYRLFEGGMLSMDAFREKEHGRVVYWGTSGQRITDRYDFDSFCMVQLMEKGVLLHGADVRGGLQVPGYEALCADVRRHYETIRTYARKTDRSLYSFGWMLDIARGLYTLKTGRIIAKTAAGEWALAEGLCPVSGALEYALQVRRNPEKYCGNESTFDRAETMGPFVQAFADVLEEKLKKTAKIQTNTPDMVEF